MINIQISKIIKNNIKDHALSEYPRECCGFMIGYNKNNTLICLDIKKSNNIANKCFAFIGFLFYIYST